MFTQPVSQSYIKMCTYIFCKHLYEGMNSILSKSTLTAIEGWLENTVLCCLETYSSSHFLSFLHGCPFAFCVCQRWVSEKLSVESLRDLELFGGEARGKASYSQMV